MTVERVANIFAGLVTVALVTTVLIRGDAAAAVIKATGEAFASATTAAIAPQR